MSYVSVLFFRPVIRYVEDLVEAYIQNHPTLKLMRPMLELYGGDVRPSKGADHPMCGGTTSGKSRPSVLGKSKYRAG